MNTKKQAILIVLDGWGYREDVEHNAVAVAKTPVFDKLWAKYPHTLLEASGLAVGLPAGQMGNSEIGHTTIGAGKIIDTDLVRIEKAIKGGELPLNSALCAVFEHTRKNNSTLHLMGLLSDGGVHSHEDHLHAILKTAKEAGIEKIALHIFTDGRDTAPQSSAGYLKKLEDVLEEVGIGTIATVAGRFYAMDRDNNWDRMERAEAAMFNCVGKTCQLKKPSELVAELHAEGLLDEHLEPIVFLDESGEGYKVQNGDAIFVFNFRSDRVKMLMKKLLEKKENMNLALSTMTEYDKSFACAVAFPAIPIETTLAAEVAQAGLTQAHIAETEKFPHATYFLNGGRKEPHEGEEHILLDSRKDVPTHDLAPKMRAESIADKAVEEIEKGTNFIFINFANPDMVGHTANVPAIVEALEEVDTQLGRVYEAAQKTGAVLFVTADHGNAEVNVDKETGEKHTAHTINPVPAIVTDKEVKVKEGTLADIAPTILTLLDLLQPESMTGQKLI
ncbi:MAG: phosphoglycerate mutase (2,3-diphosphoglycerate-independent) [Candidatus Vogelbacteria bacterium RIFOXYD1_FULL_44_32]|uniref:2,3-bisphosphoglycerate-independent phosphoglycerate mutase n=1 Tax=Candidatus Vogelbacteria bacterium RIFOXYD1_FULL_44_32 TaxID=1802438 RepID=A0A1G2QC28_9BACT|nr:MAG: phosphoglycerate mutase (2,3-diphosphoglycerate-independent) [Candidatus Vogelbacteria bacterium RIFOXYD1_FULL_44_32]